MQTPPTGIVTFLFTDVEGSTRLWDAHPEDMQGALERHDQILRSAITGHAGMVFSTAGDSFAAAFRTPVDGLMAAIAAQLALASEAWAGPTIKVRMGLHSGSAQERDGDYFGPTLNRAARIMAAGHGGQILLSEVMARTEAPGSVTIVDLGTHHLKDLGEPQRIFEATHPDLPETTSPLRSLDIRRDNLPAVLTTFIGRRKELEVLGSLIRDNRLVVLTGVGGTGKTRMAVEAARDLITDHPDGAWLIELAPVTNPALTMTAIGDAWGLRAGEGLPIDEVVLRHLYAKKLVLLVDNCEHLLDGVTAAVRSILDNCPGVRIVATSRESLGVPGEAILQVPSLGLPSQVRPVANTEAGRLFLDRAKTAQPGFEPSSDDLAAITRIVTRIDGIPLGLELAAARLRTLSPADLADRLDRSFRILSGSSKTAMPRQRTLQATIDWSHDLLTSEERGVFRRLATFSGGFGLVAAEAVVAGDGIEDFDVIDQLDSLVDKSLVLFDHAASRYRMLEPVRQYAQERLASSGEADRVQLAHAAHFADFVVTAGPLIRGPEQREWSRLVSNDYDNIRAAFATLLEAGDLDRYLAVAFQLETYWQHRSMQLEAIDTLEAALDAASTKTSTTSILKGRWAAARLAAEITKPSGIEHGRAGLALAKESGDPNAIGRMALALGTAIRHATTDPEYLEHLVEGRRLLAENPEPWWWEPTWERGIIQLLLGAYLPSDDDQIVAHFLEAIRLFEEVGDAALLGATLTDSPTLWGKVDNDWIMNNLHRGIAILREADIPYWEGHALQTLGIMSEVAGDHEPAVEALGEAAALLQDMGDLSCWATSTRYLALAEASLGETSGAARRISAVIDLMPALPMQEVATPRTLDAAARVLAEAGDLRGAAVVLGKAMALEIPPSSLIDRAAAHVSLRGTVVDGLGEPTASALLAEGAALGPEEALAKALSSLRTAAATA